MGEEGEVLTAAISLRAASGGSQSGKNGWGGGGEGVRCEDVPWSGS